MSLVDVVVFLCLNALVLEIFFLPLLFQALATKSVGKNALCLNWLSAVAPSVSGLQTYILTFVLQQEPDLGTCFVAAVAIILFTGILALISYTSDLVVTGEQVAA